MFISSELHQTSLLPLLHSCIIFTQHSHVQEFICTVGISLPPLLCEEMNTDYYITYKHCKVSLRQITYVGVKMKKYNFLNLATCCNKNNCGRTSVDLINLQVGFQNPFPNSSVKGISDLSLTPDTSPYPAIQNWTGLVVMSSCSLQ